MRTSALTHSPSRLAQAALAAAVIALSVPSFGLVITPTFTANFNANFGANAAAAQASWIAAANVFSANFNEGSVVTGKTLAAANS
nr:hypothetical protein Hi04_10k_c3780_00002 [uncultured bacterium]